MKLDRNTNPDGTGKYALLKMRRLEALKHDKAIREAITILRDAGVIHWGSEGPGEQFFVMKYQDAFTAHALTAYAKAALAEADKQKSDSLYEYALEIMNEASKAMAGNRIPD